MQYKCYLCIVEPTSESPVGDREELEAHIREHGTDDIDLYITEASDQTTLC